MNDTFKRRFLKEMETRIATATQRAATVAPNMGEHGERCGVVKGLQEALYAFEDVFETFTKVETEEELNFEDD
jgi:hypothetical protein